MTDNSIQVHSTNYSCKIKPSKTQNFGHGPLSKMATNAKDSFVRATPPEEQNQDSQPKRKSKTGWIIAGSVVALGALGFLFRKPIGKLFGIGKAGDDISKFFKKMVDDVDAKDVEKIIGERKAKGAFLSDLVEDNKGETVITELKNGYKKISEISIEDEIPLGSIKLENAEGKTVEELIYDGSGLKPVRNVYDDAGNLIKIEHHNLGKPSTHILKYDKENRAIQQKVFYAPNGKTEDSILASIQDLEYSVQDGLTKVVKTTKDHTGTLNAKTEQLLNADNNVINQKTFNKDGKKINEFTNEYYATEKTLKTSKLSQFDKQENLLHSVETTYTENEKLAERTITGPDGAPINKAKVTYNKESDKIIDLIEETNYENGLPSTMRTRQFESFGSSNAPKCDVLQSYNPELQNFEKEFAVNYNRDPEGNIAKIITTDKAGNQQEHTTEFFMPKEYTQGKYDFDKYIKYLIN